MISVLSTELQYPREKFIAAARDDANVNGAATDFLKKVMYPDLTDVTSVSHSLGNVGKRFTTQELTRFLQFLFFHSSASQNGPVAEAV